MDIALILHRKYPGKEWILTGETYEGLEWLDNSKKPSENDLKKLWPVVQKEEQQYSIEYLRRNAYREISDPIFFKWQAGLASEDDWKAAREEVNKTFPYPA